MQHIDGINLFGLISIVSLLFCAPAAFAAESHAWAGAWDAAAAKMGAGALVQLLAVGGVFYHLYNQVGGRAGPQQGGQRSGALGSGLPSPWRGQGRDPPCTDAVCCLPALLLMLAAVHQASYMVLDQGISPVTFSVGNTMKRVAVVVSSVMFFK